MTTMVWTYVVYLTLSVAITVWVGRTLRKNGKVIASSGIERNSELVEAFSHLLEVGFYLLNFGVINIALKFGGQVKDVQTAIELLGTKIGVVLLVLGFLHLVMTMVFSGIRKHAEVCEEDIPGLKHPVESYRSVGQQT